MYYFKEMIPNNIIILYILIKIIFCEEFIDLKKLSLYDSYFVILDSGLSLFSMFNKLLYLLKFPFFGILIKISEEL